MHPFFFFLYLLSHLLPLSLFSHLRTDLYEEVCYRSFVLRKIESVLDILSIRWCPSFCNTLRERWSLRDTLRQSCPLWHPETEPVPPWHPETELVPLWHPETEPVPPWHPRQSQSLQDITAGHSCQKQVSSERWCTTNDKNIFIGNLTTDWTSPA